MGRSSMLEPSWWTLILASIAVLLTLMVASPLVNFASFCRSLCRRRRSGFNSPLTLAASDDFSDVAAPA